MYSRCLIEVPSVANLFSIVVAGYMWITVSIVWMILIAPLQLCYQVCAKCCTIVRSPVPDIGWKLTASISIFRLRASELAAIIE